MKKRKLTAIAVLAVVLCLNGCGAASHNDAPASSSYKEEQAGGYYDSYASEETAEAEEGDYGAEPGAGEPGESGGRRRRSRIRGFGTAGKGKKKNSLHRETGDADAGI